MMQRPNDNKTRVVIVEDHPMFRERLAELINKEPDLEVCGEAANIRDGFELITQGSAEVAIIDITLQGSSGLELLKNLKAAGVATTFAPLPSIEGHDAFLVDLPRFDAAVRGFLNS